MSALGRTLPAGRFRRAAASNVGFRGAVLASAPEPNPAAPAARSGSGAPRPLKPAGEGGFEVLEEVIWATS